MKFNLNKRIIIAMLSLFFIFNILVLSNQYDEMKNWKERSLKLRAEKDETFKHSNTSPLAGKARLLALKDGKYYLNKKGNSLIFLKKKGHEALFSVFLKNKEWIFYDPVKGLKCFNGKTEIKSGEKLQYRSMIKIKKFTLIIYPLEKYIIATVFDPERKIIKEFKGLKYYPLNEKFYVDAIIEKINNPKKVIMLTSRNLEKTFYRSAKISFKINSKPYFLFAYSSENTAVKQLFIPFTDKTTGKGSYYTGRYLEIAVPEGKNFKLDFNLAFNPLCNYSPAYNCAIPPMENELKLKIEAGEKTYPIKGH